MWFAQVFMWHLEDFTTVHTIGFYEFFFTVLYTSLFNKVALLVDLINIISIPTSIMIQTLES